MLMKEEVRGWVTRRVLVLAACGDRALLREV